MSFYSFSKVSSSKNSLAHELGQWTIHYKILAVSVFAELPLVVVVSLLSSAF